MPASPDWKDTQNWHNMGGMEWVFSEGLEAPRSSLSPWPDWADLQKTSLSWHWHSLQGPPQRSLLPTFALDSILVLGRRPRTGCFGLTLVSDLLSAPAPVSLCWDPALPLLQLEADTSGASSFPY